MARSSSFRKDQDNPNAYGQEVFLPGDNTTYVTVDPEWGKSFPMGTVNPWSQSVRQLPDGRYVAPQEMVQSAAQFNDRDVFDYAPALAMAGMGGLAGLHAAAVGAPSLAGALGQATGITEAAPAAGGVNPSFLQNSYADLSNLSGTMTDVPIGSGDAAALGYETPGMIASMQDPQGIMNMLQGPGYGPTIGTLPAAAGGGTGAIPWWQIGTGAAGVLPSVMDQTTPPVTGQPPATQTSLADVLKMSAPAAQTAAALKNLFGVDVSPGTLGMLGTLGSTALGAFGANQQANALTGIANQARNDRLPFLNSAIDMLQNPSAYYERPEVMGAVDAGLRGLSAKVGNPINNPGALAQMAAYNLGGYNNALTSRANLGLAGQDLTSRLQTNAALANNGVLNAAGSGLNSLLSASPNLNTVLAEYLARNL